MRDNSINVDSKKYGGSRVSRKSLRDESEEVSNSENENESDEDMDSNRGSESDSEELSEIEEDVDSEQVSESGEDESEVEDDSETRKMFKQLMAKEQKAIVSQLAIASQQDAVKGEAVQHQMNIYESILDARIKAQKSVAAANQLPSDRRAVEKYSTEDTVGNLSSAKGSAFDLLTRICNLRVQLMKSDGVIGQDDELDLSKKRSYTAAITNASQLDARLSSYRDSVLGKWSRKVQASSGSSSLQSSKFKAFNQTADVQVKSILGDMDRLVKRTKVNRSKFVVLGQEATEEEKEKRAIDEDNNADSRVTSEDSHLFDDTDFYQTLLRELVDRRMADSQISSGMKWTVTQSKVKKNVDTRASKGRKLRYHVQEKIQGFDAPRKLLTWSDEQADELFSSLLGQKLKVDEEEPEESEEDEEAEVENDGLAIFG